MKGTVTNVGNVTAVKLAFELDGVEVSQLLVTNKGANPVFLGGSDVTAATGYSLAAGASLPAMLPLKSADSLWAICAGGQTSSVAVLQTL